MSTAAIRRLAAMPSPEELIGRAREMVPEIRGLAEETERNRNLFPHRRSRSTGSRASAGRCADD